MTDNKWRPDYEDLYDYAMNVEPIYKLVMGIRTRRDARIIAEILIRDYNRTTEEYPLCQYDGTVNDLADYLVATLEEDADNV